MSSKHIRPYCRILDYINAVNPDLASIIEDTCSQNLLTRSRGVTFIIPKKDFIDKVRKLIESDNIEDSTKACDLVNTLIINGSLKTPGEWTTNGEVSNSLYPDNQVVEVASTSTREVVLKSGAKITLDADFKDASHKKNLAVWKLTDGEMPYTKDKPAKQRNGKTSVKKSVKDGGYVPTSDQSLSLRYRIAIAVENTYAINRMHFDATGEHRDAYCENVCSLLNFIMNVKGDHALMYGRILPVISINGQDKFDFYVLIEPHKYGKTYLIDDSLIIEWWAHKNEYKVNSSDICAQLEKMLAEGEGALVYTDRVNIMHKIAELRQKLTANAESRFRTVVDNIDAEYNAFIESNSICGLGPIYPESLVAFYRNEPGLKILQDEIRYLAYNSFCQLEARPFDMSSFHELVNAIGEGMYAEDHSKGQKLLNKTIIKSQIAPTEKIDEIKTFINSTMFMYLPLTRADCDKLGKHSTTRPDPANITLFHIAKDLYARHDHMIDSHSGSQIASLISSLNVEKLDPKLRDELRKKLA